jgi:hypothetical protein
MPAKVTLKICRQKCNSKFCQQSSQWRLCELSPVYITSGDATQLRLQSFLFGSSAGSLSSSTSSLDGMMPLLGKNEYIHRDTIPTAKDSHGQWNTSFGGIKPSAYNDVRLLQWEGRTRPQP